MGRMEFVTHAAIPPVYNEHSRALILGTIPSPKSREAGFYYGHPHNRFWRVLAAVFGEEIPTDTALKKTFVLRHHIALWDVLESCQITGASDSSIRHPMPNDIGGLLKKAAISEIFTTGQTAYRLFNRLIAPTLSRTPVLLPSTSPANCACSFEKLVQSYRVLLNATEG